MKPSDDVRDIILLRLAALIVEAVSVSLHVVEPDLVRPAVTGLGEDQNGGGHARVGLEHAGGHGDHGLQPVALNELLADGLVRGGGSEEHAVRHDAGAASAHLEHPQKQRQEQQLRLFSLADLQQIGGDDIRVQAAFEGGIGQDQGVFLPVRVLVGEAVPVLDEGIVHAVGHHVHGPDAQHGAVHVVAVEHVIHVMILVLAVEEHLLLAVFLQVVADRHQEAGGAAGRVYQDVIFDTKPICTISPETA